MARPAALTFLLAAALCGAGCASHHPKHRVAKATAIPPPINVGTVALVNEAGHFALIDNGTSAAPPTGATLKTYTDGVESGVLQSTEVRRHPFVIADIRSGLPRKGDRVTYDPYHGGQPPEAEPKPSGDSEAQTPGAANLPTPPQVRF